MTEARTAGQVVVRVARGLAWVVGLAFALVLAAVSAVVVYARTEAGRAQVRQIALGRAREVLPGLDFARVGGDYAHSLSLDDVTVFDREGRRAVSIDRVSVRFDLWPLLRHTVAVRELEVEAPFVLGRPDPDGTLNLARLLAPAQAPPTEGEPSAPPSRWRVDVDRVRITRGGADVRDAAGETLVSGVSADGAAVLEGGDVRASLHRLVARLERDGQRLDAALSGDVRLRPAEVAIRVGALRINGLLPSDPIEIAGSLVGPRRRMSVAVEVRAGQAGRLGLDGTVGLDATARAAALGDYELRLHAPAIVLSRLARGGPDGRVALTASARGRGVPLSPGSAARLIVDTPATRVAGIGIGRAHLEASSAGPRWTVDRTVVRASGARATLAGHGAGRNVVGDIVVDVDGRLPGGRRSPLADVRGHGHLALRLATTRPRRVAVTAVGSAHRVVAGAFRLGELSLSGRGVMAPASIRGAVRLAARGIEAGAGLPPIDTLALAADGDGRALHLRASAAGRRLRADVDLRGPLSTRGARLTIQRLSLAYDTPSAKQTLALTRPTVVEIRAGDGVTLSSTELRGTGSLLAGLVTARGSYSLAPAGPGPLGTLALGLRGVSALGMDRLDADVAATVERTRLLLKVEATPARGHLHLDATLPLVTPRRGTPRLASHGPIAVHLATGAVPLHELPLLEKRLARQGMTGGTLDAAATIEGDIAQPGGSARFDLRDVTLRNVRSLRLAARHDALSGVGLSLRLEARPGQIHLSGTALVGRAEALRLDARSDTPLGALLAGTSLADAPLRATIAIPALKLESLAVFVEPLEGVSGTLAGRVELGGTSVHLSGRGDVTVKGARVDAIALGPVMAHVEAQDGRVDLTANVAEAGGGAAFARARLPRGLHGPLTAHLGAKDLDLGLARPFVPGARELGGILQASADVTGTLAAPVVRGSLALARGRIGLIGQPTFHDVTVAGSLSPGRAELESLTMRSGDGRLEARGWAKMDGFLPQSAVLTAHADGFLVALDGSTGARIDGDLAVEAALRAAVIAGKVSVPHAVVWLPKGPGGGGRDLQKIGPRADVRFVDAAALAAEERRARRDETSGPSPTLDVDAQAGSIDVRSKDMDLEVESRLHITSVASGPQAGKPALSGIVRVRRGRIDISGQRFDVERGTLSFNGEPGLGPALDIRLTRQFPDATVAIEIRGTAKHPDLRLTSDPPIYDQAQIVSLLLTGQASAQPSAGKSFDPTAAVTTMVLGRLADKLAPQLGLDVVRVENVQQVTTQGRPTGQTDTRVEVGKYVTERIFVSYAHVFGAPENANTNEAHLEYRLSHSWMLETIFGDAGVGSLDALWTYRY